MKSLLRLCWLVSLVGCATTQTATAPTTEATPPARPAPLKTPAPMTMVVLPVANKPIVSFRLVFHAGSIDDPKGKEGLTALTAELMAEGGTQELSSSELLEALFPMAAELESSTDKEFTIFAGRVHTDRLDRFFKIFSDVLLQPRLDPKEFERLRTNAVNRVKNHLRGEDDETLGKVALDALLYPEHPYRHYAGGTVQGLQSITLEDVKKQRQQVFTQNRLVIGLAGAVDEALAEKVKAVFAQLPATGAPRVELPPTPEVNGRTLILQKDSLSTAISMGHSYVLRRDSPDFFDVAFALSYLGEHRQFHGVLFQELREKRGLNYGNYAYAEHFHQEGWSTLPQVNVARTVQDFSIWIRPVEPQHAVFATRGALYFLEQLRTTPPPKDRLETAKGFLIGYTRIWEQTDQRRLGYAIDDLFYGTPDFLNRYRQAIAQMTPERVQRAAAKHLTVDRLGFVYVTRDAPALAKALTDQGPTPIQYPTPKPDEVTILDNTLATQPLPMKPDQIEIQDAQGFMER